MYILKNLPVLLALIASVIITILDIQYGADFKEVSLKLIIGISVFYTIGYFLRKILFVFLLKLLDDSEKKAKLIKYAKVASNSKKDSDDEFEPYMPKTFDPNKID